MPFGSKQLHQFPSLDILKDERSSTQVEKISSEPWIQDLTLQILEHLRSNVAWMGLQDGTQTAAKMLDYACGPGIASKVSP